MVSAMTILAFAAADRSGCMVRRRMKPLAVLVMASACAVGCASTGGVPEPFPKPGGRRSVPSHPAPPTAVGTSGTLPADGYAITGTALGLRGSPYRNGGADPSGFDCSGFVEYVFAQHGVAVPRTVDELYRSGTTVPPGELEPGDLIFFSTTGPGATHVGMAIGGDEFVHAPSTSGVVRVERLSAGYWGKRIVGVKRVIATSR